jgi:hypothetical protein
MPIAELCRMGSRLPGFSIASGLPVRHSLTTLSAFSPLKLVTLKICFFLAALASGCLCELAVVPQGIASRWLTTITLAG